VRKAPPFSLDYPYLGITGSPSAGWTFTKTASAGTESILILKTSDDAVGRMFIQNLSATDGVFTTHLGFDAAGAGRALFMQGRITTDTGALPVMAFDMRTIAGAAITTRPLLDVTNNGTTVLSMLPLNSGANMAMSWGTQSQAAPQYTSVNSSTRSHGTRAIFYRLDSATAVDMAIGTETNYQWYSAFTTSYGHKWYSGITATMILDGNGKFTTTGGQIAKVRVALTTPVSVAATTDFGIVCKLTTPGAVAVNLPAGVAGQEFVIQDGTGDAAANNITITPAAGTINGAATLVIAANYGRTTLRYDGTLWLAG